MRYTLFIFLLALISIASEAQSGGDNTYDFLSITNSARVASLGGQQVSLSDNDLNLVYHNPSLLTPEMDNHLVLNYINYFAGTNFGYAAYAWQPEKKYTLAAGLHYLNYGEFTAADPSGNKTGTFKAADYAFNFYGSIQVVDSFLRVGFNVKPIFSDYESYNSFGLAVDAGITYHNSERLFTAAVVLKNAGSQITRYNPDVPYEPLPFEVQIGLTKQLKHAPFRFSIVGQQLQKLNLNYETEKEKEDNIDPTTGLPREEDPLARFGDNLMRHVIIGVEFIPTKNFFVNVGYNYKRRQELKINDHAGAVGFSFGVGIKVKRFRISYGRAAYHLAGASNHFSITTNLSEFGSRL